MSLRKKRNWKFCWNFHASKGGYLSYVFLLCSCAYKLPLKSVPFKSETNLKLACHENWTFGFVFCKRRKLPKKKGIQKNSWIQTFVFTPRQYLAAYSSSSAPKNILIFFKQKPNHKIWFWIDTNKTINHLSQVSLKNLIHFRSKQIFVM